MKNKKQILDAEEQEILSAYRAGQLKQSANFEKEKQIAQSSAQKYSKKDSRLNIRLSTLDLKLLKLIAADKGLPYQTMISSLLHQFALNTTTKIFKQ